jgi:hypothetical protein
MFIQYLLSVYKMFLISDYKVSLLGALKVFIKCLYSD